MSTRTELAYGTVQNYVNGKWVEPSEEGMDVLNPATGEAIASVGFRTSIPSSLGSTHLPLT